MSKFKRTFLLLLLLNLFSMTAFAEEKTPNKKSISKLIKEASENRINGNFQKSLVKSRLALQYATSVNDNELISSCYNIIAANYNELTEFDKAIFFYKKGLSYASRTNNDTLKFKLNNNLGNMYAFDKTNYEKGINYYKKSLQYSYKMADTSQIVFTKLNIAWAYFDTNHFKEGYPFLKYINSHHKKHGSDTTILILYMLNAMYHANLGENDKAIAFFEDGIKLGRIKDLKSDMSLVCQEYSRFLLKQKEYKKAYDNLNLYHTITDEIYNEEKLLNANKEVINLELDEYKREIDKIETKYKTKQNTLLREKSRNKKISIVVITVLLFIILLFYFYSQNTRLKQKNRLNTIRNEIQQNIINASIDGQEQERKKIAAFLHDNISALLSSAGLHLSVFGMNHKDIPQEIIKTKSLLTEAHNKVRDLSHDLIPALLVRFGLFYALEDLCEKNSNSMIRFEYESEVDTKIRYNEEFEMKIYFIVTELLNNIVKHSQASCSKIKIKENDSQLLVQVSDNGKGFHTDGLELLESFGLNQIRARINNMKGEFQIHSLPDIGTTIDLRIPVLR